MLDNNKLNAALAKYKESFVQWFQNRRENFKWKAVASFKAAWNLKAPDFAEMLRKSLSDTDSLLTSANHFPKGMITGFAESAPEEVRGMFIDLFDETEDVVDRIDRFKQKSAVLLERYGNGAKQHFQDENVITTYLWLRYPEKYYIYKYSEAKAFADVLGARYRFKKGAYSQNVRNLIDFYDEVCGYLKQDEELKQMVKDHLTDDLYPDPELHTLTTDFGFYASRVLGKKEENEVETDDWWPQSYSPNISTEVWSRLLSDDTIFLNSSLQVMRRLLDSGGEASCSQMSEKYGETVQFYISNSFNLAKRIAKKTNCPIFQGGGQDSKWWPILYLGKRSDADGTFVWRLRKELKAALEQADLSNVQLYSTSPAQEQQGEIVDPATLESNAKFKEWFVPIINALQQMDGSGARPEVHQKVIDMCGITEEMLNQTNKSGSSTTINNIDWARNYLTYEGFLDVNAPKGIWQLTELGTRISMTDELAGKIIAKWIRIKTAERKHLPVPQIDLTPYYQYLTDEEVRIVEPYSTRDFLSDVYMTEERLNTLVGLLKRRKNLILQGAPGVGKTYTAKRLSYVMMGEKDNSRIQLIQFHQSYSYEDFVMGYRPDGDSFSLEAGVFYKFCKTAENHPKQDYFFIIDEINRGNLSKIFGELLMLIERDYRGTEATLTYSGKPFSVPKNLYLIGMMNTADRSLAMIDYALRRRFSFFEMRPGFESEGFRRYQENLHSETFDELIDRIKDLNRAIETDKSLGSGFCIGHSYFCGLEDCSDEVLRSVVDFEIIPMLNEYWFDDSATLQKWENILLGVFQ